MNRYRARIPGLDSRGWWRRSQSTKSETLVPTPESWIRKRSIPLGGFVFAPEFVDPSSSIDEFLFSRIKRMTVGADFDMKIMPDRGTGAELMTATAGHGDLAVFWMDSRFHCGNDQHRAKKQAAIITQSD